MDVESLSKKEIKEYNIKDKVFLQTSIKVLDAIEEIILGIGL